MKIEPKIAAASAELTAIRRDIHAHPELGFEEERTSKIVATKLKEWGCEVTTGIGKTGVVGTIRVGNGATCTGAEAGSLRWTGATLDVCTGAAWSTARR